MGEGDGGVGEDDGVVGVDRRHTMFAPAAFRRHRERGAESPLLLLCLPWPPPRGEEGFPSGPWSPWLPEGRSPSEIGSLSLFSSVSRSCFLALHRFLKSRRSVTPIALKFLHEFFHKLSFLCPKKGPNRLTGRAQDTWVCQGVPGAPWWVVEAVGLRLR
jgi:hypothetical protein